MKTVKKIFGIIVIGTIIVIGINACSLLTPAPEKLAEDAFIENVLKNAKWQARALVIQPSFNGFEKLSSSNVDFRFFRNLTMTRGGLELAANKWYELTAHELPSFTYYYYRYEGGFLMTLYIHKRGEKIIVFPGPGVWKVTDWGSGANWTGDMVVEEMNLNEFSGYFDWVGPDDIGGREYFRGTYDWQGKRLTIQGHRLADANGLTLGSYRARLSQNGKDIEMGIEIRSSRRWEAKRQD
ncbi:MAG: hypothetical protein FWD13_11665 [Treponema sp.]|nr:hypothetical protein [Treponema sp.]